MQSSMCWLINKHSFLFIIILSNHYALLGYIKTCMYFIFNSFDNLLMLSVFNNTRSLIVNLLNVFLEIFLDKKETIYLEFWIIVFIYINSFTSIYIWCVSWILPLCFIFNLYINEYLW